MENLFGILRYVFLCLLTLFLLEVMRILNCNMKAREKRPDKKTKAHLLLLEGDNISGLTKDQKLPLKSSCSLGRSKDNTIVINDTFSSGHHAVINRTDKGYVIEDLGSKNGTLINNETIVDAKPLYDGDVIAIGSTLFRFVSS